MEKMRASSSAAAAAAFVGCLNQRQLLLTTGNNNQREPFSSSFLGPSHQNAALLLPKQQQPLNARCGMYKKTVTAPLTAPSSTSFSYSTTATRLSMAKATTTAAPDRGESLNKIDKQQQESTQNWGGFSSFSSWLGSMFRARHNKYEADLSKEETQLQPPSPQKKPVRIGIMGGGIAGVSVAHALVQRLENTKTKVPYEITIWEADGNSTTRDTPVMTPPAWIAATARNANSMVPAAAMHVFSRKSVLWQVASDTLREMYLELKFKYGSGWGKQQLINGNSRHHKEESPSSSTSVSLSLVPGESSTSAAGGVVSSPSSPPPLFPSELFAEPPPYFAAHLIRCLGPSATHEERMSFVRFLSFFLYYTLWLGDKHADERGRILVQLARANRAMYLKDVDAKEHSYKSKKNNNDNIEQINNQKGPNNLLDLGHSQGFLSLHRTLAKAQVAVEEAHEHGEQASLLEWEEATAMEPTLERIPIRPLYVVHRPNDYTAHCLQFTRGMIQSIMTTNQTSGQSSPRSTKQASDLNSSNHHSKVEYRIANITNIFATAADASTTDKSATEMRYVVRTDDGTQCTQDEVDYLVLAAGTETPLWAARLGAPKACPTYPLRGYSLTLFTPWHPLSDEQGNNDNNKSGAVIPDNRNLLHQPFSLDSMYCSSVTPWMARFAGFGEFVGYREKAAQVPSLAPAIMERYASVIFPVSSNFGASPCFRPISPDDLPIVGAVPGQPRLFVHSGHGTLGWTMGLATGDCLAQLLEEKICQDAGAAVGGEESLANEKKENDEFVLADGSKMKRKTLSPERFDLW